RRARCGEGCCRGLWRSDAGAGGSGLPDRESREAQGRQGQACASKVMAAGPDFLVLEANFLAGTYGGAEWPPAPFRLLQAIVAGCRSIDVPGLDWLEQQPPPFILATDEPEAIR